MEAKSKVETFIGFSMRAGKFKIGVNACNTLKRAYLIIVCKSATENCMKEASKLVNRFHANMIRSTDRLLSDYTHRENSKVMAITDSKFAKLILDNIEKEFVEIK